MKSIALWPAAGAEESEAGGMDEGTGVGEARAGTVSSSTVQRGCTRRDTTRSSGPPRNLPPLNGGFCQSVSGSQWSGLERDA
jgi:hypothetical protein